MIQYRLGLTPMEKVRLNVLEEELRRKPYRFGEDIQQELIQSLCP